MKSFLVMKYNIGNEGRRRIESLEEREGNETVKAMAENARERNRNGKWKRKSFVIAGKSSLSLVPVLNSFINIILSLIINII